MGLLDVGNGGNARQIFGDLVAAAGHHLRQAELGNGADQRSMKRRPRQTIADQTDVDHEKNTSLAAALCGSAIDKSGDFGATAPADCIVFSLSCRGRRVQPVASYI